MLLTSPLALFLGRRASLNLQVSGAKFYYLRNEAALLELALVNWTMSKVAAAGFTPMITPDLVRESVFEKCGFQPRADNTQVGACLWLGGRAIAGRWVGGWGRGEGRAVVALVF